ncbi:MAG: hypothetical protein JXC85_02130 [Candidatus Aenigmarchaeota archaeon]|nr:hypothetical protein [Candidatus Aenigmarchaeota archaeon]
MSKIAVAAALLLLAIFFAGIASAHQAYSYASMMGRYDEHYMNMSELHRQYMDGELTFQEFHADGMHCGDGYGMMGFPLFWMMRQPD